MDNLFGLNQDGLIKVVKDAYNNQSNEIYDQLFTTNDTEKVLSIFTQIQTIAYWQLKDLKYAFEITKKSIKYAKEFDIDQSLALSPIYYNLGSFTLPWWSDSLAISGDLAEEGFQHAKQLLALREKNKDTSYKLAGAGWLLAGHYLYTKKDSEKAIDAYETAIQHLEHSDDELTEFLKVNSKEGIGRVFILLKDQREEGEKLIQDAITQYEVQEDDYSKGEAEKFLQSVSN